MELEFSFNKEILKKVLILSLLLSVFLIEINLTLNNPIAFGDEAFHISIAKYIGTELEYSSEIPLGSTKIESENYTRSPFWNILEGSFYFLFGFNENIVKILIPFISFLTGLVVFIFINKLYSYTSGLIASIITVTIPSFVTYSVLFYSTVPYVFIFTIAFLSLITAIKKNDKKFWYLAGIFSGLSILINIQGVLIFFAIIGCGIINLLKNSNYNFKNEFKNTFKTYGFVVIIILLIISPWVIRNSVVFYEPNCYNLEQIIRGSCPNNVEETEYIKFDNIIVDTGSNQGILNFGILNYLQFSYGFYNENFLVNLIGILFIPFAFIGGLVLFVSKKDMVGWLMIVSFIIIFYIFYSSNPRTEDLSRYTLSIVPIIGILSGVYLSKIKNLFNKYNKYNKYLTYLIIFIVIIFSFYSLKEKITGLDQIKDFSPLFFDTCDWVKENIPKDEIILSLYKYPTRYNCERTAVWEINIPDLSNILISNDIDKISSTINKHGYGYIFVQKFAISSGSVQQSYPIEFIRILENNTDVFENVFENGLPIEQCLQRNCDGSIIYKVII